MTYDCFTFFNELDLLEIRLNVLKDVVDRFVLVEAGETHTGKPKPFHFKENEARFAAFKDKIVYVGIDKFPAVCKTNWARENWQRNAIKDGLKHCDDSDTILISDLDEIPNPDILSKYIGQKGIVTFAQRYYAFYLNYLSVRTPRWHGTKMLSYADFKHCFDGLKTIQNEIVPEEVNQGTTASKIRGRNLPRSRGGMHVANNGGWHFTCLGGANAVLIKMKAVVPHHDFNPDDPTLTESHIADLIAKGQGPALKMNCFAVPVDAGFPDYIRENQAKYAHLIFSITPEYMKRVRFSRFFRTQQGRWIQFAERVCPSTIHNWLHLVKMRLLGR